MGGIVDTVINLHGRVKESGGNCYPFPYAGINDYVITAYFSSNGMITKAGSSNSIDDATIIIEYTKKTD